jgi:hypothetical protein
MSSPKVAPFVAGLLILLGIACSTPARNTLSQADAEAVRAKLSVSPGATVLFVQPG